MQTIETGALEHPNVKIVRDYQAAMAKGDFAEGAAVFDADVIYTVPGNNLLSGIYQGPQAVMGYFGKLMEITNGTYGIGEMHWLVNENNQVALFIKNSADRDGKHLDWEETILFEFKNGKKYRIEHFQANQSEVDAFLG